MAEESGSLVRPRVPRALAAAALIAVVCAVALVGLVRSLGSTRPAGSRALPASSGDATYYTLVADGGNCSYPGPPADNLYVALPPDQYDKAGACGGYLDIRGSKGTVRVKIVDRCPDCLSDHLDLSREAYARIGPIPDGIIPITYQMVRNPPLPAPLSVRVKEGSSRSWLAVLFIDHGNPLAKVEVNSGGWHRLRRTEYNYWVLEQGDGDGPFTFRVTDTAGHQAIVRGVTLTPGIVQRTAIRMYR
jgi:expansin (peptidoglycan-binding protein)